MSRPTTSQAPPLPAELQAVADAAGAVLEAESSATPDAEATGRCAAAFQATVMAAMSAGYALPRISAAESGGKDAVRGKLRGELLKHVSRTARRLSDATAEHEQAIRRADRAGLSAREIAVPAKVAPATIRSLLARPVNDSPSSVEIDGDEAAPADDHGESNGHAAPVAEWQPSAA